MNSEETKFIESAVNLIKKGVTNKLEIPKEKSLDEHKTIKVYKIPSKNPDKYTIRVDIQVEEV
jgi:hypothetical protein